MLEAPPDDLSPATELQRLRMDNAALRQRLQEFEDTLQSIQRGDVDALIVHNDIYTLQSATDTTNQLRKDVLSQMEDSVFAFDVEGHVVFMNVAAERCYGRRSSDALGRLKSEIFVETVSSEDVFGASHFGDLPLTSLTRRVSTHRLANGRSIHVEAVVSDLIDAAGQVVGSMAVIRDVSDRLAAERAIHAATTALAQRERQFATLVENSPDIFARMDRQLRHLYVSPVVTEYTGLDSAEYIGKTNRELGMPEALCERWNAALSEVFETGQVRALKFDFLTPQGSAEVFESRLMPEYSETGEVDSVLSIAANVTEREAVDAALRNSQSQLRFILDAAAIGDWELDVESDRIVMSHLFANCFGHSQVLHDWTGVTMLQQVHELDREVVRLQLEHSRLHRAELHFECRVIWPDDTVHWIEAHGSFYSSSDGRAHRLAGIVSDVTARKEAEGALRRADRQKDEFLATLAHELRNPLAPISNAVQIMRLSPDLAVQEKARSIVERQLRQMVHLVDDLLDISRISQGKVVLRRAPVDLAKVIQTAVETSLPLIDASHHRLNVSAPAAQALWIDGDATRLCQILSNLLNNAAKYTPEGGHIGITAEREGDEAVVRVQDSGVGIPRQMLPRVFDMFAQVDRTLERSQGGLGIGLALVRKLVEMHGGSVRADSEGANRGSCFSLRLPLVNPVLKAEPAPQRQSRAMGAPAGSREPGERQVLIVDDNIDNALSLAEMLEILGYRTVVGHDGLAAVALYETHRPDIAVLDIGLPSLTGHEVAQRIRASAGGHEVLLIALSGWGQAHDIQRSKDSGFDHHIVKPADLERLTHLLAS
ncbi:MAG: PAS domain S-box protein [Pseudomonadota bacterium]